MSQEKNDRLNFFTHLYRETTGGEVETRTISASGKVKRSFHKTEIFKKNLPEMTLLVNEHCYFAVATRNGGGTKEHIHQIPALWCDIDFKGFEQKNGDKLISETPSQPSAIVESGGGYHLYWFLKEPLEKSDIQLVESLNLSLAEYYHADPAPAEAARVLRIPGSNNVKYNPPRPVVLKSLNPAFRYNPDDFDWLPAANPASAPARAIIKGCKPYKKNHYRTEGNINRIDPPCYNPQQCATIRNISFDEPGRDETIFHLANHLVRGGMPYANIRKYLEFFALNCNPPFPGKEIESKIKSAIKRAKNKKINLTERIREWISATSGYFSATILYNALQSATSEEKSKVRVVLCRLVEEGLIERTGVRAGEYRIVESDCEPENWQDASTDTVKLWLPFDLEQIALIAPGSLICIAGEPNAGKTAILLNIAKENRHKWDVHYFSSELGKGAFKRRVSKFPDISPNQFNVKFYPRSNNFADVIKQGEGNLNIIDYLEIYENFYLVAKPLAEIHRKLNGAIAVVALQKNPGQDDGRGGTFTREKPVLSLALSPGKAKITKLKEWNESVTENPNRMEYLFKLVDGCRFIKVQGWHRPIT